MHTNEQWSTYLSRLGTQYGGIAGLVLHDFDLRRGEVLACSENVSPMLRTMYGVLAKNHPWAPYLWKDPVGTPIFGDQRKVYDRVRTDRNVDKFVSTLLKHKIPRGMGVILWKDKAIGPRSVVALGILRAGSLRAQESFSTDERDSFVLQIPSLLEAIRSHQFVIDKERHGDRVHRPDTE